VPLDLPRVLEAQPEPLLLLPRALKVLLEAQPDKLLNY
jgi:hypothetical protein